MQWVLAGPWNSLWDADAARLWTILSGTRAYYSTASESGPKFTLWSSEMKPSVLSVALLLSKELCFSFLLMRLVDGDSAHSITGCQFQGTRVPCSRKQKGPPFHGHFSTPWAALATSGCVGPADLMSWSRTKLLKTNVFRWIRQHWYVPSEDTWERKGYVNKLVFFFFVKWGDTKGD